MRGTVPVERRNHHHAPKETSATINVPCFFQHQIRFRENEGGCSLKLRDKQIGFQQKPFCTYHFANPYIIIKQLLEWNFPLYIKFIEYEKVLVSVERENAVKATESPKIYLPHSMYLRHELKNCPHMPDEDQSLTRVLPSPLRPGHWLDYKDYYNSQKKRYTVNILDAARQPSTSREPEACHTTTARCRTRLLAWGYHQLEQDSRSTGRKLNRWGSRPLPTHQSRSIKSPSGRWILLITCIGSMID